jgi:zinc transporter ZupT
MIIFFNHSKGLAVSLPCQREGMSTVRSFILGSVSGFIEPIGGLIGSALMLVSEKLLPYALAFAAGCMIFVVISELVPEITGANHHLGPDNPTATTHISHEHTSRIGIFFFFFGFVLMMVS